MENVVLVIHLILALLLIGAVLLQRSEGGALGMGGGGGGGGVMSGRSAATALQKATWGLIAAFIVTSLLLTLFATEAARDTSIVDEAQPVEASGEAPVPPALPDLGNGLGGAAAPEDAGVEGADETTPAPALGDAPALPPAE